MQEREERESPASLLLALVIFILWFGFVVKLHGVDRENANATSQQQKVEEPAPPPVAETSENSSTETFQPLSRHRQKTRSHSQSDLPTRFHEGI